MSDFLTEMTEVSLQRAAETRQRADVDALRARADSARPALGLELDGPGFDLIAEAKLASPSTGRLAPGSTDTVVQLARQFEANGAAAVSILTEETRFGGVLEHLERASTAVGIPVMRKDFLVDPIQIFEARAAGASGVLLIARMLPGELLVEMTDQTLDLGMFALVEVFDRSDLETAVAVFDRNVLVGVNSRDLASLEVDRDRFASLAPHLPNHLPAVAESGIDGPDDIAAVARSRYRLALVGASLVSATDPGAALSNMLAEGRAVADGLSS